MMTDYENSVIPLWLVVYDQDPECAYILNSKEHVLQSIEGSIKQRLVDVDDAWITLKEALEEQWGLKFIRLKIGRLELFIQRLEIDRHVPIGRLILDCYDRLNEDPEKNQDLLERILNLLHDRSL